MANEQLREQLKKLIALQNIDAKIYQINIELDEKPAVIQQLQNQFESKKQTLQDLEAKQKELVMNRKNVELELKEKEDAIAKAQTALSQLKTNKEYSAKLTEIESLKADKSISEEKILISFDEGDVLNQEIEKEKKLLAEEETKFKATKGIIDKEIVDLKNQLATLEGERKTSTDGIDANYLARYEKILKHKDGLAIVPVSGAACGGCFMNVTSQNQNAIRMWEDIVECPMCSRILYIEEVL